MRALGLRRFRGPVLLLLLGSISCVQYNHKIEQVDRSQGYRYARSAAGQGRAGDLFFVLSLSGGGTRAAALAYGVMEQLHRTVLPGTGRVLLDEVDVLSSVSGGSFTAAYYALFGNKIFDCDEFRDGFLNRNVQRDLWLAVLNPKNLLRLPGTGFSRTDVAVRYYDRHLFHGKEFRDLDPSGDPPYLVLNSTVVSDGSRFEFTQDQFDANCSDLEKVKIAAGVTASAALPGPFKPLRVNSFGETCGYSQDWFDTALHHDVYIARRKYTEAKRRTSFTSNRRFIHLTDGGVADNIGLRWFLEGLLISSLSDENRSFFPPGEIPARLVVISVNAKTPSRYGMDERRRGPFVPKLVASAGFSTMANYSAETLAYVEDVLDLRKREYEDRGLQFPETYFIEVSVEALAVSEPESYQEFGTLRTRLRLPRGKAEWVAGLGARLLEKNPYYQELIRDLSGASSRQSP